MARANILAFLHTPGECVDATVADVVGQIRRDVAQLNQTEDASYPPLGPWTELLGLFLSGRSGTLSSVSAPILPPVCPEVTGVFSSLKWRRPKA